MKFTQSHHTIEDVIEDFEALMSHMQKLINNSGKATLIKNTKLGEMHDQLVNIKNLNSDHAAALALIISVYNQINRLFDGSLDISFKDHEVLDLVTGRLALEGPNDKSSDRLFELGMAIRFARGSIGSFAVSLETDCDIIINNRLAIECKNLQSAKKVKQRVRYASDQLERRFEEGLATHGFIAVDVSALIDRNKFRQFADGVFECFEGTYTAMSSAGSFAPTIRENGILSSIKSDANYQKIITSYIAHQAEFALHSNLGDFRLEHLPKNCWGIIIQSTVPLSISDNERMVPIPIRTTSYFLNPSFPEKLKGEMRDFLGRLSTGF